MKFINLTGFVIFATIISIPLFLHLHLLPFRLWDESRLAMNAYEMHKDGNFLVTHYEGAPEMWNTKPPLMIWLQVLSIRLLGFSELAIRLPSAIAGMLTCIVLVFFSKTYLNNYLTGAFAAVVLVTTNGYIDIHAVRTGDYEGLLTLFTTIFTLCGFLYAETAARKWLLLFFAGVMLAVLTKSIQPLLFLPGIALYYLIKGKLNLVATRTFLFYGIGIMAVIAAYYLLREYYNPGYLKAIWLNELGGRYFNALEENYAGPEFYASRMPAYFFPYWIWLLPAGIISGFLSSDTRLKKLTLFTFIVTISYFLFITISKTKLYWYTVPLFPLMAIHVAIFIYQAYDLLNSMPFFTRYKLVSLIIVSCIFIYPYWKTGRKVYHPAEYPWDYMYPISNMLQDAMHGRTSLNNHVISYKDYDQHLRIYLAALKDKGQNIVLKEPSNLAKGDTVIACEKVVFDTIENKYHYQLLQNTHTVKIYLIR